MFGGRLGACSAFCECERIREESVTPHSFGVITFIIISCSAGAAAAAAACTKCTYVCTAGRTRADARPDCGIHTRGAECYVALVTRARKRVRACALYTCAHVQVISCQP